MTRGRQHHHHSLGTLQRDTDDTVAFHTNLNATHTAQPPDSEHPPEPHPALPTTPWHHTRHWIDVAPPLPANGFGVHARRRPLAAEAAMPADWLYELTWPSRPLPAAPADRGRRGVAGGRRRRTGRRTRRSGRAPVRLADARQRALRARRAGVADRRRGRPTRCSTRPGALVDRTGRAAPSPPKLFILTRNAQPVADGDRANPAHAVLWGLGRTLALEHPEIWGGIIDVDESVPAVLAARRVLAEAHAGDGEDQVVYRAGVRHVPRLQPTAPAAPMPRSTRTAATWSSARPATSART